MIHYTKELLPRYPSAEVKRKIGTAFLEYKKEKNFNTDSVLVDVSKLETRNRSGEWANRFDSDVKRVTYAKRLHSTTFYIVHTYIGYKLQVG